MITPLPGATPTKPGTATLPFFGVDAAIVDDDGKEVGPNEGGKLVIRKPWPSMLRGIFNDHDALREDVLERRARACYFTGDGARRDKDGYFWIMGRIDDVLNVAGHRLGTAEVESALVSHPAVAEAAVVGRPDEMKGQGVVALRHAQGRRRSQRRRSKKELKKHVAQGDRRRRQAGRDPLHRGAAQDPQRQDHAPPAQGNRRRRRGEGRHDDAGGLQRHRGADAEQGKDEE